MRIAPKARAACANGLGELPAGEPDAPAPEPTTRQPVALLEWIAEKNLRNGLLDPDMRDTLKDELEAKIAGLK